MTTSASGTPGTIAKSKWLALTAMMFAVAMTFIDQTIVAIAAPEVQSELSLTASGVTWMINAYILALAAGFALGGRIADVFGSRLVVLVGIIGFAVSSGLCGATPATSYAETWMIVFRATQGFSAALMIPAALAVVVAAFPVSERGKALAIFFGVSGGLTAVGPIAGGYLTQWTWRAIFWINLPIAVIAVVLTIAAGIHSVARREPIDWRGAALVAAGMALSVFGFEQARSWGWDSPWTWACIVGGLLVLVVFVLVERRTEHPLIKVRIFRGRAFAVDNGVLFFSMVAFIPIFFFASVYAQVALGYDANTAGLYLLMIFVGFAPAAQVGGRILDTRGARPALIIGSAMSAVGFVLWGMRATELSLGDQWWCIVLAGAGLGLLVGPASTDATNRAIDASYGEVTGITQTVRNYGSALGLAVLGTLLGNVFTNRFTDSLISAGVPADRAATIAASAANSTGGSGGSDAATGAPPAMVQQITQAVPADFAVAVQAVLYGMAVALAVSFVISLLHPGDRVIDAAGDTVKAGK